MFNPDTHDCEDLMELEKLLENIVNELRTEIDRRTNLEIILLDQIKQYPMIKISLTMRNKIMALKTIKLVSSEVNDWVSQWIRSDQEINKLKLTLRQVEGKRDSLKKVMSIKPI